MNKRILSSGHNEGLRSTFKETTKVGLAGHAADSNCKK